MECDKMGYSEIENLWYATTSNIQAFWNSNLKRHTAHANLWCATKWNIQKLESETPHLHPFCVIWNISEILRTRDRNPIKRTHTEKTPNILEQHPCDYHIVGALLGQMTWVALRLPQRRNFFQIFSNRFRQMCFFPISLRNQEKTMILRRANKYWNSFSG